MTPEEFTSELRSLAPSRDVLLRSGFESDNSDKIIETYKCNPKNNSNRFYNDTVLELLSSYDCSKLELGLVNFRNTVVEDPDYFFIGEVEANPLVISKITKEVQELYYTNKNHVVSYCAANSDSFLDSLLSFATFLNKRLSGEISTEGYSLYKILGASMY